jgi:signal transduction histidine kinase
MIDLDRLQRVSDSSLQPSMLQLLDEAQSISDCVRNLSHNLHPARVDLLPLGIALGGLCREFMQRTSIEVRFEERHVPALLPIEIKVCLYRVAQEALQNIAKHSRANRAEVELTGDGNGIRLRVDDDGVGFVVHQPPAVTGLGLASMRERLTSVAGSIKVTAAPRQGTRIEAYVPLHQAAVSGLAECA